MSASTSFSFDPRNPRLLTGHDATQLELLELLYEEQALDELVESFIHNGYFEEEPLVAVREAQTYRRGGQFPDVQWRILH